MALIGVLTLVGMLALIGVLPLVGVLALIGVLPLVGVLALVGMLSLVGVLALIGVLSLVGVLALLCVFAVLAIAEHSGGHLTELHVHCGRHPPDRLSAHVIGQLRPQPLGTASEWTGFSDRVVRRRRIAVGGDRWCSECESNDHGYDDDRSCGQIPVSTDSVGHSVSPTGGRSSAEGLSAWVRTHYRDRSRPFIGRSNRVSFAESFVPPEFTRVAFR
ncbi:MAG: hypothetical protein ACQETB_05205 [Halobacteriota archaeon]